MNEDIKSRKADLRTQALRNRAVLGLDPSGLEKICHLFLKKIPLQEHEIIAGYCPKDRELDVTMLLDTLLERGFKVVLPVVEKGSRLLKFVAWDHQTPLVTGVFSIAQPQVDENTQYLEPDVFLIPMLAFDRIGGRLGFGGGYYDTTLAHYRAQKKILSVGIAYAEQACLFNLPAEEHDMKMDWVITQQQAHEF